MYVPCVEVSKPCSAPDPLAGSGSGWWKIGAWATETSSDFSCAARGRDELIGRVIVPLLDTGTDDAAATLSDRTGGSLRSESSLSTATQPSSTKSLGSPGERQRLA